MILFDNIDMHSIANVKIEDIRVSSIQYSQTARDRAVSPGSDFVRNRAAKRTVSITFAILTSHRNARQAAIMAINAWAKTDKEYKLELEGHPDHYLMAVCTAKPDPSLRQWWESKLRLVFTCFDNPFWNDKIEKSVACGTPFFVLGDAPPLMRIVKSRDAAASDQSYSLNGKTITFSTIPAGDMVINLNAQTARSGSTNIMQYYTITSRWLEPVTGAQTITGDGIIKYRERFS